MGKSIKNALVVGATGGLGTVITERLQLNGYAVDPIWLNDNRPDVWDKEAYESSSFSHLDLGIYLTGTNITKSIEDLTRDDIQSIFQTNVFGAFNFAKNNLERIKSGHNPTFVFISSIMVTHPYPNRTAYAASKAAIEGLSNALAVELGEHGISSICIRLGHLSSLMKSTKTNPALLDQVKSAAPQGNLIDPIEVADFIIDMHSSKIKALNGSVIDFDAGYTKNRWPL